MKNTCIRLTKVKESRRLTLWGWILIIACILLLTFVWRITIHDFLAKNKPVNASILVIEGYVSDSVLDSVVVLLKREPPQLVVCAGLPFSKGELCSEYGSNADYNAAMLRTKGVDSSLHIISAPSEFTDKERTYTTALKVKERLKEMGYISGNMNVVCVGTHARRSLLLYRKALGQKWNIGVYSFLDSRYPGNRWWKTSEGARDVVYEMFGYIYCLIFFHP